MPKPWRVITTGKTGRFLARRMALRTRRGDWAVLKQLRRRADDMVIAWADTLEPDDTDVPFMEM